MNAVSLKALTYNHTDFYIFENNHRGDGQWENNSILYCRKEMNLNRHTQKGI